MASSPSSTDRPADPAGDGVEITAPRARQAYRGRRVLWILLVSIVAVLIAFAIAFLANPTTPVSSKPGGGRTPDASAAQSFHAPEPAPKEPSPANQ